MEHTILEEKGFRYVEEGEGEVIVLLHGLFGALSNFKPLLRNFREKYKVAVPILPLYSLPLKQTNLQGFLKYVSDFIEYRGYKKVHLLGNSLGGHIALMYTLQSSEKVQSMILTGSSGLYENQMGNTFPRRDNYEFVKTKTEDTFYDPTVATKELVDEVYEIVNNREKALRTISTARSAIRNNLSKELDKISVPTLLVWGLHDTVTPPFVAEEFNELIAHSQLKYIDKCGHAPMMECPEDFNRILESFLQQNKQ